MCIACIAQVYTLYVVQMYNDSYHIDRNIIPEVKLLNFSLDIYTRIMLCNCKKSIVIGTVSLRVYDKLHDVNF